MNTQNPKSNKQTSAPTEKKEKIKHMYISMWSSMIQMYFRCGRSSCKMPKLMTAHTHTCLCCVFVELERIACPRSTHHPYVLHISIHLDSIEWNDVRWFPKLFVFFSFLSAVRSAILYPIISIRLYFSCNIRFTAAWTNLPKYGFCCCPVVDGIDAVDVHCVRSSHQMCANGAVRCTDESILCLLCLLCSAAPGKKGRFTNSVGIFFLCFCKMQENPRHWQVRTTFMCCKDAIGENVSEFRSLGIIQKNGFDYWA